jgi:LysM repeat protein
MKNFLFALLLLTVTVTAYAQDYDIVRHEVKMGETVKMISKKYKVLPAEIYKRNKFAVDGVRAGMVLQIPVEKKTLATEVINNEPEVITPVSGENSIALDVAESTNNQIVTNNTTIVHTIQKGDTLYGIARKYKISIEELKSQNPDILQQGFHIGQIVKITLPSNPQ